MNPPTMTELIPVLQVAIGPVILISGIGLLLLSMTNRYGRTIDRSRELARSRRQAKGDLAVVEQQIDILLRRARILRRAILLGTLSVLFASILIILLFSAALLELDAGWLVGLIFIACLGSLIGSLVDSMRDVNASLRAVKLEIGLPPAQPPAN